MGPGQGRAVPATGPRTGRRRCCPLCLGDDITDEDASRAPSGLFYLFSDEQLRHLFQRLGYEFGPETARKNIAYYDARTSHGSTRSFITHAAVLASLDPESSWDRFIEALESDIGDAQGGTTKEGIHLGVMSGTLDLIQRGYVGTDIRDGVLHFNPRLTDRLDGLSFPMQFRGTPIRVTLKDGGLTVDVHTEGFSRPIRVAVGDAVRDLRAGDHHTSALKQTTRVNARHTSPSRAMAPIGGYACIRVCPTMRLRRDGARDRSADHVEPAKARRPQGIRPEVDITGALRVARWRVVSR